MTKSKAISPEKGEASQDVLPLILVGGPTGSGKSVLAARLAYALGGHVVNADSMQVYRELPVLTAQPGTEERALAPHHLFGALPVEDPCSVGRWYRMAADALATVKRKGGTIAVLAGGTGLYLKAAAEGLAEVPDVPDELRRALDERYRAEGEDAFRHALAARDPDASKTIKPGDRQRLVRAMAVVEATGRTLGAWQAKRSLPALAGRQRAIFLLPPRAELYAACDARFAEMIEAGAVEEARALLARRLNPDLPLMKAVGLREIAAFLDGSCTREEMIERGQRATRRYAKRQYTWFRHQMPEAHRIEEKFSERLLESLLSKIHADLLTAKD